MKYDHDRELVYFRKSEVLAERCGEFPGIDSGIYGNHVCRVQSRVIGFCGGVWPLVMLDDDIFYSIDEIDAHVHLTFNEKVVALYHADKYSWKKWKHFHEPRWPVNLRRSHIADFFVKCPRTSNLFEKHRVPVFEYDHERLTLNPSLDSYQFYRIFDTNAAYQEIAMFVGGLAQAEKPIPSMSDNDMVDIKGFDKWSFRKRPR